VSTKKKPPVKRTNKELNTLVLGSLMRYFSPPENVIFFEVAAGTGARGRRRIADAVTMGCWPSRGMQITGIEIKVSRSDWLREKNTPAKAEEIAAYCDRWALVSTKGVAAPKEVPHAWDWYEVSETGQMKLRQQGFETEAKPLDRSFVASMLRSAGKVDQAAAEAIAEQRTAYLRDEFDSRVSAEAARRQKLSTASNELTEKLCATLGTDATLLLHDDNFLAAVKAVHELGVKATWKGLGRIQKDLETISICAGGFAEGIKINRENIEDGRVVE